MYLGIYESIQVSFFPLLKNAPIIGEIGMDSVWCDVDLKIQKEVFEKQLRETHIKVRD